MRPNNVPAATHSAPYFKVQRGRDVLAGVRVINVSCTLMPPRMCSKCFPAVWSGRQDVCHNLACMHLFYHVLLMSRRININIQLRTEGCCIDSSASAKVTCPTWQPVLALLKKSLDYPVTVLVPVWYGDLRANFVILFSEVVFAKVTPILM